MFIIVEIPIIAILFLLVAIIGIWLPIAYTVIFWLCIIIALIYWGICVYLLFLNKLNMTISLILGILGFLCGLFAIYTFYGSINDLKTLLIIFGIALLVQFIIALLITGRNRFTKFICCIVIGIFSVILCMWTLGYNLSYLVKHRDSNIAYYECMELKRNDGVGKSFRSMEEFKAWIPERLNGDIYGCI